MDVVRQRRSQENRCRAHLVGTRGATEIIMLKRGASLLGDPELNLCSPTSTSPALPMAR